MEQRLFTWDYILKSYSKLLESKLVEIYESPRGLALDQKKFISQLFVTQRGGGGVEWEQAVDAG